MHNPMNEHFILNNRISMPKLGIGAYQSGAEETMVAVTSALSEGYRMRMPCQSETAILSKKRNST